MFDLNKPKTIKIAKNNFTHSVVIKNLRELNERDRENLYPDKRKPSRIYLDCPTVNLIAEYDQDTDKNSAGEQSRDWDVLLVFSDAESDTPEEVTLTD